MTSPFDIFSRLRHLYLIYKNTVLSKQFVNFPLDFADIFDSGSGSGSGSGSEGDDEASGTNLRRSSISPNPSATESKNQNKVQPIISPEDEENQEDSGSGSESGSGSGEGTEEKRSKIVEEIVTDMARAALEAGHSDTGIKKSDLPTGSLNNEFIEASVVKKSLIEVPRSVDDADEDSLKFTVKRDNNSVASSQNKDEVCCGNRKVSSFFAFSNKKR